MKVNYTSDEKTEFKARIFQFMKLGISQKQMAYRLKLAPSTVCQLIKQIKKEQK